MSFLRNFAPQVRVLLVRPWSPLRLTTAYPRLYVHWFIPDGLRSRIARFRFNQFLYVGYDAIKVSNTFVIDLFSLCAIATNFSFNVGTTRNNTGAVFVGKLLFNLPILLLFRLFKLNLNAI